jgi:hypothetical protein
VYLVMSEPDLRAELDRLRRELRPTRGAAA